MTELFRHIGPDTDVPAGDIGVGGREIGFLFGQYKRLRNEFTGVLTGKGLNWGGSLIRPEATGYGAVYFAAGNAQDPRRQLRGQGLHGLRLRQRRPVHRRESSTSSAPKSSPCPTPTAPSTTRTASTRRSWPGSWTSRTSARPHQGIRRQVQGAKYLDGKRPWGIKCDCAFPSATQNEINGDDAKTLLKNGCFSCREGANMPSTPEAVDLFLAKKILYGPGKAANAGGVATSGLEMCQNSMRLSWTARKWIAG